MRQVEQAFDAHRRRYLETNRHLRIVNQDAADGFQMKIK